MIDSAHPKDPIEKLKCYIAEDRYRIKLDDLIRQTVDKILEATSGESFALSGGDPIDKKSVTARVRTYEDASSTLLSMAAIGGRWAEESHTYTWQTALQRLSKQNEYPESDFWPLWIELQRYPGTLLLYALGMGAVATNRLEFLQRILTTEIDIENQKTQLAFQKLPPRRLISGEINIAKYLEGMENHPAPLSKRLCGALRPHMKQIIPDDGRYKLIFNKVEIFIALSYAYRPTIPHGVHYWTPMGAFGYQNRPYPKDPFFEEIEESISRKGNQSPFVTCGLFGETAEDCQQGIKKLEQFILSIRYS